MSTKCEVRSMKKLKMKRRICLSLQYRKDEISSFKLRASLSLLFALFSILSFSQVTSEIDTTKIRVGEQINYKIKVETDSSSLVVFPEGQTFAPLEAVEALKIDTTKRDAKFLLSRIYKLTQFDSGSYTIPRQKIIIGDKPFFTDSLKVDVNTVTVDTTKQKLYDIKPLIEVDKSSSNWWKWLLAIILAIALSCIFIVLVYLEKKTINRRGRNRSFTAI